MSHTLPDLRLPAIALLLAPLASCENDVYIGPLCFYEADEAVSIDEGWQGIMPRDAADYLNGWVGDWPFTPGGGDEPVVHTLRATAELAGEPRLWRLYHYVNGYRERCDDDERRTTLGVPLRIELTPDDGAWSFSGVQTAFASPPDAAVPHEEGHWDFLPEGGDLLKINGFEPAFLDHLRARSCNGEVGARLNRTIERVIGDRHYWIGLSFSSWCDDRWMMDLAHTYWYPRYHNTPRPPADEPE